MIRKTRVVDINSFHKLFISEMWRHFKAESFAFWAICGYLFLEYVRPQSIYPAIDILPWTQLALIGALFAGIFDKSVKWVESPVNFWIVVFLTIILISSIFSYWPSISFKNLENLYIWVIIYFLIVNIVNTERRFYIFICIFFLASFKLSLSLSITWANRGFSFTDWGLRGPPGFFQNSGELSIQMLVFWPLAWAFAVYSKPYIGKFKYYVLLMMPVTAIMVILGASSRGAQLALIAQLIAFNYKSFFKPKVLCVCVILFSILWFFLPEEQKDRFQSIGDDRTSQQRILYWENGVEMINDHPFLGVGFFNYVPYYEIAYRKDMLYKSAELPHNIFIQVGTDAGYIGISIFLILLAYAFLKSRETVRSLRQRDSLFYIFPVGLNVSLLGFLIAGQFVTVAYYPFFWIHISLVVVVYNVYVVKFKRPHR